MPLQSSDAASIRCIYSNKNKKNVRWRQWIAVVVSLGGSLSTAAAAALLHKE